EKADALCNLIHFIGDIHQPLHTVARFTTQTPDGDRGGNQVFLRGRWKNLHSLWDNALNLTGTKPEPESAVPDIVREWPLRRFTKELTKKEPDDWAREGYDLAVSSVYTLPDGS